MKEFWNIIQLVFSAVGGWLGYFLGGCDGLLIALLVFVVLDYLTGLMCAIVDKKLSSEIGFRGIFKKVLVFIMVGIGHMIDLQVLHGFFLEITDDSTVTDSQLAALIGISPAHVERLTAADVLKVAEPRRGIADYIGIDAIAALDLRQLLSSETDETIDAAERRRAALIDAVRTADSITPSKSQWELHAVQSCWNAFIDSLPTAIVGEARA